MATCPTCRTHYSDDVTQCAADGSALLPDEAFANVAADLAPGEAVGEYRIESKLGQGGFGAVYKAVHPLIGKTAAIKVLGQDFSSKPEMVARFISEARSVNQIHHRGIIDIFSFGALPDGRQYYVMELLEGATLDAFMKQRGRLSLEEAIPILRGIARAIDAAHGHGIAHRDLKPENVFLTFDDEGRPVPKVLDFGIAKLLGETSGASKTRTGTPMGTPHYMSPEQSRGVGVDTRTDIYSFGVMTYEMLTGKLPFDGEAVMDILLKQITERAEMPSVACPAVPPGVDAAILVMMEKEPEKRPASLVAAVDELTRAAATAGAAVSVPMAQSSERAVAPQDTGPKLSAGEIAQIASAKTMVQGSQQTLIGASNEVAPAPKKRTWLVVAPLAVLLIAGLGFGATRLAKGNDAPAGGGGVVKNATGPSASQAAVVPSASTTTTASATEDANVHVTVEGAPPGAEVFQGEDRLGAAGEAIALPRGKDAVVLSIRAKGYASKSVTVTPKSDEVVSVTLDKTTAATPTGTGKKKDRNAVENPF